MIKGIGIDICQISRLSLDNAQRILTDPERQIFNNLKLSKLKKEFLAGRFSAKEAIFKALSGLEPNILLRDIIILNDESGKPYVEQPKYKDKKIFISISHEIDYAVAQAIVEEIEK